MADWEAEIKVCAERLSEMENKKLHLMRGRLWKRVSG
jgi:hypothetical protein